MRFFCVILAFLFAWIAGLPCSDGDECIESEKNNVVIVAEHDASGDLEYCSPFCVCNCCSNHLSRPLIFAFNPLSLPDLLPESSRQALSTHAVSQNIWQPPRV